MPHNNANLPTQRPEVLTRPKLEGGKRFILKTEFTAAGDQPTAIAELTEASEATIRRDIARLQTVLREKAERTEAAR